MLRTSPTISSPQFIIAHTMYERLLNKGLLCSGYYIVINSIGKVIYYGKDKQNALRFINNKDIFFKKIN